LSGKLYIIRTYRKTIADQITADESGFFASFASNGRIENGARNR